MVTVNRIVKHFMHVAHSLIRVIFALAGLSDVSTFLRNIPIVFFLFRCRDDRQLASSPVLREEGEVFPVG
jgi:hypothetical protein